MLLNNLKIAFRSLRKNRLYTGINIIGLGVGIAAALVIFQIVSYEIGFNKNFSNYNEIVRIIRLDQSPDQEDDYGAGTPTPAMDEMENVVPQFEELSRIRELWDILTIPGGKNGTPLKKFRVESEEVSFFVENDFLDIFEFQWLVGDKTEAMESPGTIILTREWAEKCFGNISNAMGKTLLLDHLIPVKVEGVIEDLPGNCDFPIQYLVSYETLKSNADHYRFHQSWGATSSNNQVYALLSKQANRESINALLRDVGAEEYAERNGGVQSRFHLLQPLSDLHFNLDVGHSGVHQISKTQLKILSMIGILILAMACFNFINLSTAQSSLRAKEVGVRKTLGGLRKQLIFQFMTEVGLVVFASIALSIVITVILQPWVGLISNLPSNTSYLSNFSQVIFLGTTFFLVTLFAGLYPSFLLSSYAPISALNKNKQTGISGGRLLRKSLVVFQFSIAQVLIIGAMITIMQMNFIKSKNLGFKKDLVYTFHFNSDSLSVARQTELRNSLQNIPSVESVSLSTDQPLSGSTWASNFRFADRPEDEPYNLTHKFCDNNYGDTYKINLLSGKWYSPSDTMKEAVINNTLLKKLGIQNPVDAIGQRIRIGGNNWVTITGVCEDFHTHSFRQSHQPLLLSTIKDLYREAGLKIKPNQIAKTTQQIQKTFDAVFPEQVFDGSFLEERIALHYEDEERMLNTSKSFGLLAILISCLGLFGLATHTATQRVKEIGIRKVLGSSVFGIVRLLSMDFLKLVLFSLIIAIPIAYFSLQEWLNNFIFHIEIQWWIFALTGFLTMIIAFSTVSIQSIKAALKNPIESLKSE